MIELWTQVPLTALFSRRHVGTSVQHRKLGGQVDKCRRRRRKKNGTYFGGGGACRSIECSPSIACRKSRGCSPFLVLSVGENERILSVLVMLLLLATVRTAKKLLLLSLCGE